MGKKSKYRKKNSSSISADNGRRVFYSTGPEETRRLGSIFVKSLKPGTAVCLTGELGAGKTTFIKGMAEGMGIRDKIKSPTFIIVREYPQKNFYHFDLYRINKRQFLNLDMNRYFTENSICVLEWAEKIKSLWREDFIRIKILHKGQNDRTIRISRCD